MSGVHAPKDTPSLLCSVERLLRLLCHCCVPDHSSSQLGFRCGEYSAGPYIKWTAVMVRWLHPKHTNRSSSTSTGFISPHEKHETFIRGTLNHNTHSDHKTNGKVSKRTETFPMESDCPSKASHPIVLLLLWWMKSFRGYISLPGSPSWDLAGVELTLNIIIHSCGPKLINLITIIVLEIVKELIQILNKS